VSRPLDVVIVGGGTAGWMAAAGLVGRLTSEIVSVRLIESEEIGTVGVGEATLPHLRKFNEAIGLNEAEVMAGANATFKLAIEFVDWGAKGSSYIHPFGKHGQPLGGAAFHHQWIRTLESGRSWDLQDFSFPIVASRKNRFDFPSADVHTINSTFDYAYQLDASLYARQLRAFAEARGARRIEGKVVEVSQHPESGDIASVRLASGEVVAGDLFIDCSGFRSLLLGQTLGVGFEDWSKWLPCDRALAVPCERTGELTPYTRSTAREAGWQWRIPLQHRTGNGYVYCSSFISDDEAARALLANLDGAPQGDPRPLRFTAGRRDRCWAKNCVAIGLASGFLEPLESTSIYLIQVAILNLLALLPRFPIDPALADEFDRLMDNEYERIRDFLILHYCATTRDDAELWRYCRDMEIPDTLQEKIRLFVHRGYIEPYKDGLFAPPSWLAVFVGQGIRPRGWDRLADNMALSEVIDRMDGLRSLIADQVEAMPTHDAFVRSYCPSPAAVSAGAAA
jgi:tryptophan halogenase